MKPSQITQIIIRLFTFSWCFHGILQTLAAVTMRREEIFDPILFLPGAIAVVLSICAWFLAPSLGRFICRGNDKEEIISGITFEQLLQAMFIGIGLYFCASSIGDFLNGLHLFIVMKASPESIPVGLKGSIYQFTKPALTFIVGGYLIFSARHWSSKITKE